MQTHQHQRALQEPDVIGAVGDGTLRTEGQGQQGKGQQAGVGLAVVELKEEEPDQKQGGRQKHSRRQSILGGGGHGLALISCKIRVQNQGGQLADGGHSTGIGQNQSQLLSRAQSDDIAVHGGVHGGLISCIKTSFLGVIPQGGVGQKLSIG